MANHKFNHDHHNQLQDIKIIFAKYSYMDSLIREASELKLQPNIMNSEDGDIFSGSWKPPICSLKRLREWLICSQLFLKTKNFSLIPPLSSLLFSPSLTWWLLHSTHNYVSTDVSPSSFVYFLPPPMHTCTSPSSYSSVIEYIYSYH